MLRQRRRYSFDEKRNYNQLKDNQEKEDPSINNKWNSTQEKVMQQRGEQALGYLWMHNKASKHFEWWNYFVGIIAIITGTTSGTGAIINIAFDSVILEIFIGFLAYVSGASGALMTFLSFEKKSGEHRQSATQFQAFVGEIKNQLAMKRCDRKSGNEYMEATRIQFDRLVSESPDIIQQILDQYTEKVGESEISKPDIANGVDTIIINTKIYSNSSPNEELSKEITDSWKKPDNIPQEHVVLHLALQDEFERQVEQKKKEEKNKRLEYQQSRKND